MFSLHERTQRKVCRAAFLILCAVPTIATLGWVAYFHRPWHERDWRRVLESDLHARVDVGQISAPRPLARVIEFVQLTDLRATEPMIRLQGVEIQTAQPICIATAEVDADQLHRLAQAAEIWLSGESVSNSKWQLKDCSLVTAAGSTWALQDLRCETKVSPNGIRQCLIIAKCDGKPIRLSIERDVEGKLRTLLGVQQVSIPAWLLADTIPGASRWLGAALTGILQLEAHHSMVSGSYRGTVDNIDTKSWMGSDSLQALAKLRLENLTWQDGRVVNVQGTLQAASGRISSSFLLLLKEKLLCTLAVEESQLSNETQLHSFDGIGLEFQLSNAGLAVTGMFSWGEKNKGSVITSAGKPFVSIPAMPTLPLSQLVQLVSPHNPYWVPATREAIDLGEKLPLPESATRKK